MSIHIAANGIILFFIMAEQYFSLCVCNIIFSFICQWTFRLLPCLAIVNSAAIWTLGCMLNNSFFLFLFGWSSFTFTHSNLLIYIKCLIQCIIIRSRAFWIIKRNKALRLPRSELFPFFLKIIYLFGCARLQLVGSLVCGMQPLSYGMRFPDEESNPGPVHWEL